MEDDIAIKVFFSRKDLTNIQFAGYVIMHLYSR